MLLFAAAALAAEPLPPAPSMEWDWGVDLPVTVAAGGVYALLYFSVEHDMRPYGLVAETSGLDALVPAHEDDGAALASDVVLYGTMGAALGATVLQGARHDQAGTHALVYAETFALNGLFTETLKLAVRRPRPYTALDGAGVPDDLDREMSFPSGHTSFVASTAFCAARAWHMSGATPAQAAIGYGAATALTGTVATLRVAAGRHHPTDVLAGALLGGAVGFVVPTLHRAPVQVTAAPGGVGVSGTF